MGAAIITSIICTIALIPILIQYFKTYNRVKRIDNLLNRIKSLVDKKGIDPEEVF